MRSGVGQSGDGELVMKLEGISVERDEEGGRGLLGVSRWRKGCNEILNSELTSKICLIQKLAIFSC